MPTSGSGSGTPIGSATTTAGISLATLYLRIRFHIGDETASGYTQEFSDSQLLSFITPAVEMYSHYRPHTFKDNSLVTVANQDLYAVNANAFEVVNVIWNRLGTTAPSLVLASGVIPWFTPLYFNEWQDSAVTEVRDQLQANLSRFGQTQWREVNYYSSFMGGRYVILYPCPTTAGEAIQVWYDAAHPLNAEATAYTTIPAQDIERVARLAVAAILRRKARIMLMTPDLAQGQSVRVGSKPAQELRFEAYRLEMEVLNELGSPVSGRG